MLTPEQLSSFKTIQACEDEIVKKAELYSMCVGQLYRDVLNSEISQLSHRITELRNDKPL